IEGSEPYAIEGAKNVLKRDRPILLMEVNREALSALHIDADQLWAFMSELGYRAWRIGSSHKSSGPLSDIRLVERCNVILHHVDLPTSVLTGWSRRKVARWSRRGW